MRTVKWVEVWVETASGGLNIYTLRELSTGEFQVLDPQHGNRIVETFDNYDDAANWLGEDEYVPAEGRIEMDTPVFGPASAALMPRSKPAMLTDEKLREIRARVEATPDGKWEECPTDVAPFFANARADVLALLAEVERLRAIEKAAHEMRDAVRAADAYLVPEFEAFDALTRRDDR